MSTTIRTADQISAYSYRLQSHKVNSLESFVSTVRLLREGHTDYIGIYTGSKLKGIWHLTGDDCEAWYQLLRPTNNDWAYHARTFA